MSDLVKARKNRLSARRPTSGLQKPASTKIDAFFEKKSVTRFKKEVEDNLIDYIDGS